MEHSPTYLTSVQVAELAGVRPETVARWANEGRIDCTRTAGGHRRFRKDHVDAFLTTLGHHPEPETVESVS